MPDLEHPQPRACCVCNTETINYTHYEYNNTGGYVCEICNIPSNLTSDWRGITMPNALVDHIVAYDADSSNAQATPQIFFESDSHNTFECCHCNHQFYGDGIQIQDWDDYACLHCADIECYYDDNTGNYYSSETAANEANDGHDNRGNGDYGNDTLSRQEQVRRYLGAATNRYLQDYTIGVEFEHAPNRGLPGCTASSLFHEIIEMQPRTAPCGEIYSHLFTVHGDGSIAQFSGYSAAEVVTSAVSGSRIDTVIDRFYEPFARGTYAPGPEHHSCGFHVHVESKYLMWIKRNASVVVRDATSENRNKVLASLVHIHTICNNFISQERRNNHFCNASPAMRDKNMGEPGTHGLIHIFGRSGYPGIAIRSIGTIEFRIWPSTNSKKYMKARVELSQKLTQLFDHIYMAEGSPFTDDVREIFRNRLMQVAEKCKPATQTQVVSELSELLDLSSETVESLIHISSRFHPFSHGKTHFKFNDRQLACLREESAMANQDIVMPADPSKEHNPTIQDTTVSFGNGMDVYLTLTGAPKCYPPTNESALNFQKQYAKGDI